MTSYQELTAGGESSSTLFAGYRRAKEVINQDLDGAAQPGEEFGSEAGLDGLQPDTLTLCAPLDAPPLPPHPAPACTHSPRVPWRRGAQGQGCAGPSASKSSSEAPPLGFEFGSLTKLGRVGTEVLVAVGSSAGWTDVDVNRETFEWMRVKRSRQSAGEFVCACETENESVKNLRLTRFFFICIFFFFTKLLRLVVRV